MFPLFVLFFFAFLQNFLQFSNCRCVSNNNNEKGYSSMITKTAQFKKNIFIFNSLKKTTDKHKRETEMF